MASDKFRPFESDYTDNLPKRGDGRGLGKPIRKDGRWVGQACQDIVQGKPTLVERRLQRMAEAAAVEAPELIEVLVKVGE
jgi:hypothetical protein